MTLTINEDQEQQAKWFAALNRLQHVQVDVGLTSKASGRSLFLMRIHAHGAPIMRIPPRPVVQPALAKASVRREMAEHMKDACRAAKEGEPESITAALEAAGQRGADGIREYIDTGIDPPNSPKTLSGGWIYNRVAKKGVLIKGKSGSTPMKDTGQLYDDFDYELRER